MVAPPVPRVPRKWEPPGSAGLGKFSGIIARAGLHQWLTFYLSVWLCIALLGLCVTSTRSFRTRNKSLLLPPRQTPFSSPSCTSTFSLQPQHPYGILQQIEATRWGSSAAQGTPSQQPAVRVVRGTLAAVSLNKSKWHAERESVFLSTSSVVTLANSFPGAFSAQREIPTRPTLRFCCLLKTISRLFSSFSADLPFDSLSLETNDSPKRNEEENNTHFQHLKQNQNDKCNRQCPTDPQLPKLVQEADSKFLSLRGIRSRLRRMIDIIIHNDGCGAVEESVSETSGKVNKSVQAHPSVHLKDSGGNSPPADVQNLSLLAIKDEERDSVRPETGFVSLNDAGMQGRNIPECLDTPPRTSQGRSFKDTHQNFTVNFLPVLPDDQLQQMVGSASTTGRLPDSPSGAAAAALPPGKDATAEGHAFGPLAAASTAKPVQTPAAVPPEKRNESAARRDHISKLAGSNNLRAEVYGHDKLNVASKESRRDVTTSCESQHSSEQAAASLQLQRDDQESSLLQEKEKQLPLGSLQQEAPGPKAPEPAESQGKEGEFQQPLSAAESKNQGYAEKGQDTFDLPAAVADQLLAALQGPPAQQALAARALVSLVAGELSHRDERAEACVELPGDSEVPSSPHSKACQRRGSLVNRLLQGGLVGFLERIINTPSPKPFWPRWLHREADPDSKQAIRLLLLQLDALHLLTLLHAFGAEVERHLTSRKTLMKTLERFAARILENNERADAASCPPHSPQKLPRSPTCRSKVSAASQAKEGDSKGEEIAAKGAPHFASPSAEFKPTREFLPAFTQINEGETKEVEGASGTSQDQTHAAEIRDLRLESPTDGGGPVLMQGQRAGVSRHSVSEAAASTLQSNSLQQKENFQQLPKQESAAQAAEDSLAANGSKTAEDQQTNSLPYVGFSPSVAGDHFSDSRVLRAEAEKLAIELLHRLGEKTGAAVASKPPNFQCTDRSLVGAEPAEKSGWWRSFLLPLRAREAGVSVQRQRDETVKLILANTPEEEAENIRLHKNFPFGCSIATSDDKIKARQDEKIGRKKDAVATNAAPAGVFANPRKCLLMERIAEGWKDLCKTISRSLLNVTRKTTKLNPEASSKVFWIPLCLSAGDSGVWTAIAAVGGEDLAAAMKRRSQELLQATESQQTPGGEGGDADMPHLSPNILLLLREARVETFQPSGSQPAAWGVLGVAMEERPLDLQLEFGIHPAAADSGTNNEEEFQKMNHTGGNTPLLAGQFATKKRRMSFQVLCLLTGPKQFQAGVQTLGIRTLLDAAVCGKPETKIGALQALARLIRSGIPDVSKKIFREMQTENTAQGKRLCMWERGLAHAILAPYSRGRWWRLKRDEADIVILEKLQLAALDFLYAWCTDREEIIPSLQNCPSIRAALNSVISFCTDRLLTTRVRAASTENSLIRTSRKCNGRENDEALLFQMNNILPPGERHTRVLQEHARPLRLATIVSSALGGQRKWKPRVAGQRGLRILALDGGGTRGVLTVALLKHLAASVGKELSEVFDIICGTSTGGIIAVLLGMEKASAAELETLYDTLINEIFVKDSAAVAGARLVVRQAYYDESLWESLLQRAFGDTRMVDFAADESIPKVFCLSTMVSTSPAKVVVWRNYNYPHTVRTPERRLFWDFLRRPACPSQSLNVIHSEINGKRRYEGSCCVRVRDALRATTAAPGFFIGKQIENEMFVDGALLANNPAAIAIAEAKALFPGVPIEAVVSIGTGKCTPERCEARTGWDGIFNQLINAATNTEAIHELLRDMLPESVYFRFNPEINAVSIDETSKERLNGLKMAANLFFENPQNKEDIQRLADILRPASPLQKRSRSLVRIFFSQANSLGRWMQKTANHSIEGVARIIKEPLNSSDSSFLRLLKCCLAPRLVGENVESNGNKAIVKRASEEVSVQGENAQSNAAAAPHTDGKGEHFAAPGEAEHPLVGPSADVKKTQAEDIFNLHAHVVAGGRRSFLAWLLGPPKSKLQKGSNGIFDTLELLGRRHLSSINEEELESLVPLTGVRHVLHGIFQHIKGQL